MHSLKAVAWQYGNPAAGSKARFMPLRTNSGHTPDTAKIGPDPVVSAKFVVIPAPA
nr:hypothetical protein SHINE37_80036 [Rhizobiaceae bacterium]